MLGKMDMGHATWRLKCRKMQNVLLNNKRVAKMSIRNTNIEISEKKILNNRSKNEIISASLLQR